MSDLGNKDIFVKNLKYYMEINHKNRNDICKDLNFPYTTFAEWYNGNIYPRIDKIEMLANYFNIKKSDLIERKEKNDILDKIDSIPLSSNPDTTKVSIIGTVRAGYDYLSEENVVGYVDVETSLVGNGSEYFALIVTDDSMSPIFIENDIVIVHKQNDCENNEIAIVIANGDEGTIKKVRKTDEGIELHSINPYYPIKKFTKDEIKSTPINIVGIVKQLKRNF